NHQIRRRRLRRQLRRGPVRRNRRPQPPARGGFHLRRRGSHDEGHQLEAGPVALQPARAARALARSSGLVDRPTIMSRLLALYRGQATDSEGRWLHDVWSWDDEELESVHDFIQWLFPLPEPSQFNPDAPLLTPAAVAAFRAEEPLRANLRR